MDANTVNVTRKKLKLLEGIVINRNFCNNKVQLPNIFEINSDKSIAIDHIVAVSNMARIMKNSELSDNVQELLGNEKDEEENKMSKVYRMMSLLLATGNRPL